MADPEGTPASDGSDPSISARMVEIERIHKDVHGRIGEYLRRNAENAEVAEELTQKAGAKLWVQWTRNPAAFKAPPDVQHFAERVARNHLNKHRRNEERWSELLDDVADVDALEPPDERDYLDDAVSNDRMARVHLLREKMPRRMRQVLDAWLGGYEYPEIAAELGIEESTARSHVFNAGRFLARSLGPHLEDGR